jgi:hypothetical protein
MLLLQLELFLLFAVAYEWEFQEVVGLRGVTAVAADPDGAGFDNGGAIFATSGELGTIVRLFSSTGVSSSNKAPGDTPNTQDAVGNEFAQLVYIKVRTKHFTNTHHIKSNILS